MATSAAAKQTLSFKPVDYDAKKIPPEAPAGKWKAKLHIERKTNEKKGYPMLVFQWTLRSSLSHPSSAAHTQALKMKISDYLGFPPPGDKWERGCKRKLAELAKMFDIDLDALPKRWKTWKDFDGIVKLCEGKVAEVYTIVKPGDDGGDRAEIRYTQPRGFEAESDSSDDEDEEGEDVSEDDEEETSDEEESDEEETEEESDDEEAEETDDDEESDDEEDEDEEENVPVKSAKKKSPPVAAAKKTKKK